MFMYILLLPLIIIFIYLNYKIIISDFKEKIIPNKYIIYLFFMIPFFYLYLILWGSWIDFISLFIQIFISLITSFVLYYFWIWSAWDAKYLLILSLFIPKNSILDFVWNIAILTILYLFLYFLWFYFWRCLFDWKYTIGLYNNIYFDLKDKWIIHKSKKWWKTLNIILKWILIFLIIFVSIRLSRIYIFSNFFNNWWEINIFLEFFNKYNWYLTLFIGWLFIWLILLIKLILTKFKKYIINKFKNYNISENVIDYLFIIILSFILIGFIIYEYLINPIEIKIYLIRIFTLYIWLWILFKILLYTYKITFHLNEIDIINIKSLKKWDIVDKTYLIKMFWTQISLWYTKDDSWKNKIKSNLLFYPNPLDYFNNIENPIDNETKNTLIKVYKIVNKYHKKNDVNFVENNQIKILKTFAFGWYIFLWFLVTYFFGNSIFNFLVNNIIKNIYHY